MKSVLSGAFAAVVVLLASCQDATSIFVEVFTNVPHRSGMGTTFTVGAPGTTETAAATTETRAAFGSGGFVGSLGVVPATDDDAVLSVKVVLGVQRDVRDCSAPDYAGCIVARRVLRYRPHTEQTLLIHLNARCENVPCDDGTTCDENGECVSAGVGAPTSNVPIGDAAVPNDGSSSSDGSSPKDATIDGAIDGTTVVGRSVDCPGPENPCTGSQGCCWQEPSEPGNCVTSCSGNLNSFIGCDGPEDCSLSGQLCCLSLSLESTRCSVACASTEVEVCHSTGVCTGTKACSGIYRGHYKTCQ